VSAHTPGPWTVHDNENDMLEVVQLSTSLTVAELFRDDNVYWREDARLIAEAPAMLDIVRVTAKYGTDDSPTAIAARALLARLYAA